MSKTRIDTDYILILDRFLEFQMSYHVVDNLRAIFDDTGGVSFD